jgi:ComF family protein
MWIVDLLVPRSCVFCGVSSEGNEQSICAACYADLPWNEPAVAPEQSIFECSIAMLHYSFPVDVAIKSMKFSRKLFYAPAFSEILCSACPLLPQDIDAILPVPLHWRRKMMRGFNQAAELAKPVARALNVPLVSAVVRQKSTPFQSGLNVTERAKNLRRAFNVSAELSHRHVLIVDDVVTTGATTQALGVALQAAGVQRISVLAVARAG